jgi:hypothetical protein
MGSSLPTASASRTPSTYKGSYQQESMGRLSNYINGDQKFCNKNSATNPTRMQNFPVSIDLTMYGYTLVLRFLLDTTFYMLVSASF